jgi:hypothetical protein
MMMMSRRRRKRRSRRRSTKTTTMMVYRSKIRFRCTHFLLFSETAGLQNTQLRSIVHQDDLFEQVWGRPVQHAVDSPQ